MLGELEKGKMRLAYQIRCFGCGKEAHIRYNYYEKPPVDDAIYRAGWTWSSLTHWLCPACSVKVPSYNPSALRELIEVATMLTKYAPIAYDHGRDQSYCVSCGTSCRVGARNTLSDESLHAGYCPWRLLKEAIANLDNKGYVACEEQKEKV